MNKGTLYPPLEGTENSMLLSSDLKKSFQTVRDIHFAQRRLKKDSSNNDVGDSNANIVLEKHQMEARKFEAALAAAVAAESEMMALRNGIVELESILLSQKSMETNVTLNEKFPTLPHRVEEEQYHHRPDFG